MGKGGLKGGKEGMELGHLFAQGSWVQSSILVGVEERGESFAEMMTRLGSISEMMGIASMSDWRSVDLTRRVKTERGTKIILFSYCLVALHCCRMVS